MMLNMRDNEIREEGREEGRMEGRILQTIKIYRDLVHYSDEQIINTVMKEFKESLINSGEDERTVPLVPRENRPRPSINQCFLRF